MMFLYANENGSAISQTSINLKEYQSFPVQEIDLEYNVSYTIFDYVPDDKLPPCLHFLDNFLESEVYVFSLPLSHSELNNINSKDLLYNYCTSFIGYPKCAVESDFEIGWIGLERQDDLTILSNLQLNGLYRGAIDKKKVIQVYQKMLGFCEDLLQEEIYIPTAATLKTLSDRFSNHPEKAIMETPYTSKVLKGYKKTLLEKQIYANKYLNQGELEFYVKRDHK